MGRNCRLQKLGVDGGLGTRLLQATKAGRGGPGTKLAWTTRKEYYLLTLVTLLIAL